jgi:hypothetical protein
LITKELLMQFAAAFSQQIGLDPTRVVLIVEGFYPDQKFWFRPKTDKEIELDSKSEMGIAGNSPYCPECPCENCKLKRVFI